jgi:hypothetical protein
MSLWRMYIIGFVLGLGCSFLLLMSLARRPERGSSGRTRQAVCTLPTVGMSLEALQDTLSENQLPFSISLSGNVLDIYDGSRGCSVSLDASQHVNSVDPGSADEPHVEWPENEH